MRHAVFVVLSLAASASATSLPAVYDWSGIVEYSGSSIQSSGSISFSTHQNVDNTYDLVISVTNMGDPPNQTWGMVSGLFFDLSAPAQLGALGMRSAYATGGLIESGNYHAPADFSDPPNICAPGAAGGALANGCAATVVGGWQAAYSAAGLTPNGVVIGDRYGVGTTGQGVFGGRTEIGQADYSILPNPGGIGSSPNSGVTSEFPYVYGTAEFTLFGLPTGQVSVSGVYVAFGTQPEGLLAGSPTNPSGPTPPGSAVPETSNRLLLGSGLVLVFSWSRLRRSRTDSRSLEVNPAVAGRFTL